MTRALKYADRSPDHALWWEIAGRCSYATFSHTPAWQALICESFAGVRPASVIGTCRDGTRFVFPMLRTASAGKGLLHGYSSSFAGCYGGPIADAPLTASATREIYRAVTGLRTATLAVCGNPFAPQPPPADITGACIADDYTQVIDLEKVRENPWAAVKRGHRNRINRGRKSGLGIREAVGEADYRRYFEVYQDTLTRWGKQATSRYPWRLFAAGARLAAYYPDNIRLWLAERDGETIAGAWAFVYNGYLCGWQAACRQEQMRTGVNHYMHYRIMRQVADEGVRYYDFYPSGGHAGSQHFKADFGAEPKPLTRWRYRGPGLRLLQALRPGKAADDDA